MRKIIYLVICGIFLLAACGGVDSDLLKSGKIHQCNIIKLKEKIAAEPENEDLKKELKEILSYYNSVINSAKEESRAKLEEAIKKALEKEGCN